jgi:polyhydroxybutyrate depolymerase
MKILVHSGDARQNALSHMRTQNREFPLLKPDSEMSGARRLIRPVLAAVAFVLALLPSPAHGQGRTNTYTITHADYNRTYALYVPSTYSPLHSAPLALHIAPSTSLRIAITGLNVVAEREDFLVAYPDPLGEWLGSDKTDPYDDTGFLLAVIDHVSSNYAVNASQVYADGYSAGGVMSEYLSVKYPYRLAAVASVAGVRPYAQGTTNYAPLGTPATPCRPFPVLHMHGTADPVIPYAGGYSAGWRWPPVEQVVADYFRNNGCSLTPSITNFADIDPTDGCTVQMLTYGNSHTYQDTEGVTRVADVLFYRVVGGGHSWPGNYRGWPSSLLPANHDVDASEQIWAFFSRHRVAAAPPGRFDDFLYSAAAGFRCTFRDAAVGQRYRIQTSTSLLPGSWTDFTNVIYTGPVVLTDNSATATTAKFYRAISP